EGHLARPRRRYSGGDRSGLDGRTLRRKSLVAKHRRRSGRRSRILRTPQRLVWVSVASSSVIAYVLFAPASKMAETARVWTFERMAPAWSWLANFPPRARGWVKQTGATWLVGRNAAIAVLSTHLFACTTPQSGG